MKGRMLRLNLFLGMAIAVSLFAIGFSLHSVPILAAGSTNGNFTVTPDDAFFNWTGDVMNITSSVDGLRAIVNNTASEIVPVYYNSGNYTSCGAGSCWPNDSVFNSCFTEGMAFLVENSTGTYGGRTYIQELNTTNSTTFNVTAYQYCPPGKYTGYFYVYKNGTASERAKLSANLTIPVNPKNTFNYTGRYAYFKGHLAKDGNYYHSFYFNTSGIENSTGGTIKITGFTGDVDLFLFAGSSLLQRSVKVSGYDEIEYLPWPSGTEYLEIRVYGNSTTNYMGYIYFNPLNAANASDESEKFNDTNPVDFGVMNPDQNSSGVSIRINNTDSEAASNVSESAEIYRHESWNGNSQAGTYRFFVPGFAEKVKVRVEWDNTTVYNLFLEDAAGGGFQNSSEKYRNANITGSVREEYISVNSSYISGANDGYWNVTVYNLTQIKGTYNVTAYVWMPAGEWYESSFVSGYNFNSSGLVNQSAEFSVKITAPEVNATNGTYGGFLRYNNSEGWKLHVPLRFQVKAGTLLINSDNISSSTYTVKDNIGFNRLGADALKLNITYNNTGGETIYYTETNSSNRLYLTTNSSNYVDFVVDTLPGDGTRIENNTEGSLNIRLLVNTSRTNNYVGSYRGNITFNTTNSTSSSSSHPFDVYVLTINLILNNTLTLNLGSVVPGTVLAPVNASNVTANVTVQLYNGTYSSVSGQMELENFTGMRLTNVNLSGTYYNLYNSSKAQGTLCSGVNCYVNWTLQAGAVGGQYRARVTAALNTSQLDGDGSATLSGTHDGTDSVIVINDEGLQLTSAGLNSLVNDGNPLDEGDSDYYSVYIKNYGPVAASNARIMFNNPNSCEVSITPVTTNSSCMGTAQSNYSGTTWTLGVPVPAYMSENNCTLTWRVTANSVTEDKSWCYMNVGFASDHSNFGNLTSVGVEVHDNTSTGGDSPTGGDTQPDTSGCTSDSDCADTQVCSSGSCTSVTCSDGYVKNHKCYPYDSEYSFTSYEEKVYVLQGESNSTKVTIKNNGAYTRITKLNATIDIEGVAIEVSPSQYSLASGNSGVFEIGFNVSGTAEVGYHDVALKVYVSTNESISRTQEIKLAVQPTEETKQAINVTRDDLKRTFESLATQFSQISPGTDTNYTLANRTYNRLLSMFQDIEEMIGQENYLEVYSLLKDANSSITEFRQQIADALADRGILPLGDMSLVIILVVIIVIGAFLVYLLLPSKKGYHPVVGYMPRGKTSLTYRIKHLFSKLKNVKGVKGKIKPSSERGQMTLERFERESVSQPAQQPVQQRPPSKAYEQGYEKEKDFRMSYKKKEMKDKGKG